MDHRLTRRQAIVLRALYRDISAQSARDLGVRSDVLWRLEERGLVTRNIHQQWRIRPAGRDALDNYTAAQAARPIGRRRDESPPQVAPITGTTTHVSGAPDPRKPIDHVF